MQNSFQERANGKEEPTKISNALAPQRAAKVVIVGAGLAGLSAAQRLHELGLEDVIVLDALDRVGGRVHTISHSDYLLELGAQWLHGADDNPLYQWLTKKNMLDDFEDASLGFEGLFCTNRGEQIDPELVKGVIDVLVEGKNLLFKNPHARSDEAASTASQIFRQQLENACGRDEKLRKNESLVWAIFDWFLRFEAIENGCNSMDEVSIASYTDWTDSGDGALLNFKHGYRSLVDWFCAQFPAKQWIHLNRQVLSVELLKQSTAPSGSGWLDDQGNRFSQPMLVRYKSGGAAAKQTVAWIECDHVIVTVSLGFLKKNHETFFKPQLPRVKRDLIDSIGFGTVNKIVLQFDRPFWNNDHSIKLVWDRGEQNDWPDWVRDILSFDVVRRQPNLLVGWVGGRGAQDMESESDANIAGTCLRLLNRFLPEDYNKPSRLLGWFCSRWNSNPFTCGSYSFQSMRSLDQNVDKLHEPLYNQSLGGESNKLTASSVSRVPRVLFAGEATAGKLYATTHGAIITGWREADRLVDSFQGNNKSNIQQTSVRNSVPMKTSQ